jgi:hypothetical protein
MPQKSAKGTEGKPSVPFAFMGRFVLVVTLKAGGGCHLLAAVDCCSAVDADLCGRL